MQAFVSLISHTSCLHCLTELPFQLCSYFLAWYSTVLPIACSSPAICSLRAVCQCTSFLIMQGVQYLQQYTKLLSSSLPCPLLSSTSVNKSPSFEAAATQWFHLDADTFFHCLVSIEAVLAILFLIVHYCSDEHNR